MPDVPLLLVAIVAVALFFDYTNGAHDSANAIATVVSTKVLSPKVAVVMAAVLFALLYAGAALVTLAMAAPLAEPGRLLHASPSQFLVLAYLGLAASGVGFFLFNAGARRVDVGTLAVFNNAKVPLAILASALVFGEHVAWLRVSAGGAVLALALALNGSSRPRP